MKKKTIILIILAIIMLFVLSLFGIKLFEDNSMLSKSDFISLMDKESKISNVKIETTNQYDEGIPTRENIRYKKDNIILDQRADGICFWSEDNHNIIGFNPEKKEYSLSQAVSDKNLMEQFTYTFIGTKEFDNIKCAVGKFEINDKKITMWVNIKNGLTLKIINEGTDSLREFLCCHDYSYANI